jgi:hypothetical protein
MKLQKIYLITFMLFLLSGIVTAQIRTQTLKGRILDTDTRVPLSFVNVYVLNSDPVIGTMSDDQGYFKLENVPLGRVSIQLSFLGYEEKTVSNLVLISGKEIELEIEMSESITALSEIVISSRQHKSEISNEMAQISSKSVLVEESNRYAGSFGDPARLVSSFAGVSSAADGNNDIIVRGNNSRFIQWRLEGTEIPNPNHFAQEGMTGGPISALNSKMLANSEFYTGAFAPQYGNALGGIFDMRLRTGNSEKREHSISVGALGLELSTEGPLSRNSRASYLINYRYSTLALLDELNLVDFGGVPKYQDVSFKVVVPTQRMGTFSLFGLGGNSNINSDFAEEAFPEKILESFGQESRVGVLGFKHSINVNQDAWLHTGLSFANNRSKLIGSRLYSGESLQEALNSNLNNNVWRFNSTLNYKLNAQHLLQGGLVLSNYNFDFNNRYFDPLQDKMVDNQKQAGQAWLGQLFVSWKWRITENLSLVNGIHSQKTSQNSEITIEPRTSLRMALDSRQTLTAGTGIHSSMSSLSNYFAIIPDNMGISEMPNANMQLLKARHYVLGYENRLSKNLFLKLEAYYQDLYDIPVEAGSSSYSLINQTADFTDRKLVNEGKGRNLGLELTLERYFADGYYFLLTASVYNSEYKAGDGKWRNSRYNGNYVFNALAGKEFKMGRNKNNVLAFNAKTSLLGARRVQNIKLEESIVRGYAVYDEDNPFAKRGTDVFVLNFAVSYRLNKRRVTHEFKADIQNMLNNQATIDYYFNSTTNKIESIKQLALLPVVSYTLNF